MIYAHYSINHNLQFEVHLEVRDLEIIYALSVYSLQ